MFINSGYIIVSNSRIVKYFLEKISLIRDS
nr:MAG TPA: hypothetical protein [Caudoviricetes sp.]